MTAGQGNYLMVASGIACILLGCLVELGRRLAFSRDAGALNWLLKVCAGLGFWFGLAILLSGLFWKG